MTIGPVRRTQHWPVIWGAVVTILVLTIALFTVAFVRISRTVECVNHSLLARDALVSQLSQADVDKVSSERDAERLKAPFLADILRKPARAKALADFHLYVRGETQFLQALIDYIETRSRIQAAQVAHPLGNC